MIERLKQQHALVLAIFTFTLFLSASLMFMLQPMVGRMLMPLIGGTPSGWIVALAFFQIMLLLGYFLAHYLSRFDARQHAIFYTVLMAIAALSLPVSLTRHADIVMNNAGAFRIFALLTLSLGAPFVILSATSSTIQRLFTATGHKAAADPYFLYAASNLGSFGGLIAYPFVIERLYGVTAQTHFWLYGYIGLIAMAAICILLSEKTAAPAAREEVPATRQQRIRWILLAFVPSSLMMGVTTHITTDVFAAPMIWIFPLGFYLLTFVLAFARRRLLPTKALMIIHPLVVVAITAMGMLNIVQDFNVSLTPAIIHVFAFMLVALSCHTMLADLRPDQKQLTDFYLMLAVGGALGGVLNAFILPYVLDREIEYYVMMILSLLLLPAFRMAKMGRKELLIFAGILISIAIYAVIAFDRYHPTWTSQKAIANAGIIGVIVLALASRNLRVIFAACVLLSLTAQVGAARFTVYSARNFYGVLKVYDLPMKIGDSVYMSRTLSHGTTTHGIQVLDPAYETTPTTYYAKEGPVGDVFKAFNFKDIAVVGLGSGTMNCYSTPENAITFIDIDEDVVKMNKKFFTYLSACQGRKPPEIVIGDGRLALQKMEDRKFDMILLDAFSADNVPVHLLTEEAIKVYLSRLNPGGVLLFNVSNRYFNLGGALSATADKMNLHTRMKIDAGGQMPYITPSVWLAMSRDDVDFTELENMGWGIMMLRANQGWTDDYADLLGVIQLPMLQ